MIVNITGLVFIENSKQNQERNVSVLSSETNCSSLITGNVGVPPTMAVGTGAGQNIGSGSVLGEFERPGTVRVC
jgi:hypothetical protein